MADDRTLAERLLAGDKRALARGISLVEDDDPEGWALVREIYPHTGSAAVVGFTGPPGVGKSTLIGRLIEHTRALERQVAVLSIDPSSPSACSRATSEPSPEPSRSSRTTTPRAGRSCARSTRIRGGPR